MKRNNTMALLLGIILLFPVFHLNVFAAEARNVVYTEFISGNFNHAGDGTLASPYNLFEDAMNAVAGGGTIYILGGGAFINDIDGVSPLRITKNVTIAAAPGVSVRPSFVVRPAGIVLGANVTFQKIELSFESGFRPVICANGYTLTLNDVFYDTHARTIHLAGGGMFYKNGVSAGPEAGAHSRIVITGEKSSFGNIYAGSINGSFEKDVDITAENISGRNIGAVYACGAAEGYYNSENFLDPGNEPDAPGANPYNYPVNGKVSVSFSDTGINVVNGETGGSKNAFLSISAHSLYTPLLRGIETLEVKQGTVAPRGISDNVNVLIQQDGILDMSSLGNCSVNDFTGGGIVIVNSTACLTVRGNCTGETKFRTNGGLQNCSGIAQYGHCYIKTAGDGTFTFTPYPTQNGMTLEKRSDGWWTSAQGAADTTALTAFDFDVSLMFAPLSQINGEEPPYFSVFAAYTEDTPVPLQYIEFVPFEYAVTYNGKTYSAPSDNVDGYYEGNIKDLNMNFYPADNTIMISSFSNAGTIAAGTYDIDITAPTTTGNVTRSLRLVVVDDAAGGSQPTEVHMNVPVQEVSEGDMLNLSATVTDTATGQGVSAGGITLYINGQPYRTAQTPDSSGAVSWKDIAVTRENGFAAGENQLTAAYSGNDTYALSQQDITITVNRSKMFEVNEDNGKVDILFTNLSGKDIGNALLLIGVYDGGVLRKTAAPEDSVTIRQGETQEFHFDMAGVRFDGIRSFLWDSLETMTPLVKDETILLDE